MPRPKAGEGNSDLIRYALLGIDAEIKALQEKRAEMLKSAPKAAAVAVAAPAAAPAAKKRRGRKPGSKKAKKLAQLATTTAQKLSRKAAKGGAKKGVRAAVKAAATAAPKKRKVSAETRKRLSEAAQARWAKARQEKGK